MGLSKRYRKTTKKLKRRVKNKKTRHYRNNKKHPTRKTRKQYKRFRHYGGEDDENECPICYEPLSNGVDETFDTRCHHKFHKRCIYNHFRRQEQIRQPLTCPYCRSPIERPPDLPRNAQPQNAQPQNAQQNGEVMPYVIEYYSIPHINSTSDEIFTEANRVNEVDIDEINRESMGNELLMRYVEFEESVSDMVDEEENEDTVYQLWQDFFEVNNNRIIFPELGYAIKIRFNR